MVVVPYRPYRSLLLLLTIGVVVAGGLAGGFWFGYRDAVEQVQLEDLSQEQLQAELALLESQNAELQQQVVNLDQSQVMDSQTNVQIQATIMEMREYITQLENDVQYYRQAMSEDFDAVGLVIGELDIQATEALARYKYKLVLRQQGTTGNIFLEGQVNVVLQGRQNGEHAEFPLSALTEVEDLADIKLRFKYFQTIEGELQLPDGFVPDQVLVTAVATTPMEKTLERSFSWIVEGD